MPHLHRFRKTSTFRRGITAIIWALFVLPSIAYAAAGAAPQDQISRNFEKTFTLSGNQGVSLDHRMGHVRVTGVAGQDVKISAVIHVQARSQSDAQAFADKIQIDVQQSSDGVHVKTIYPPEVGHWFSPGGHVSYSVDYDVSMPINAPLWLRNDFGDIDVTGVHGGSQIQNGHGSMTVRDAGSAKLVNSFGRIELDGASGDCTVTNNNGEVSVAGVKGALDARNRFGAIQATQIGGPATISGGNGTVELNNGSGNADITNSFGKVTVRNLTGNLIVHNNAGNVDASDVSGSADLNTNFGAVQAERIGGTFSANDSNGQVKAHDVRGFTSVKTSFGTVDLRGLHQGVRVETGNGSVILTDIEGDAFAKTSFGSVQAQNIRGNLTVQDSNGSVTAASILGDAGVDTSFSGVTLTGVGGKIRVNNQNGAIDVTAAQSSVCKDVNLKTSFSAIIVRVPASAGYKISARTSFGHISSDLPVTSSGVIGQDSLNGTIGNGACTLELTDSNGNIDIAKVP
jgi:hypothetical protein